MVPALLITRGTLKLMSFIGVIMLMGLVAKDAILLLDAARVREAEGMDREEALMAAGRKRLRPILMKDRTPFDAPLGHARKTLSL